MHSLRTKITMLTVCSIVITAITVSLISVTFLRSREPHETDQLLLLLCETGEHSLDHYFNSVQRSVEKVADYARKDLNGLADEQLSRHIERVSAYFDRIANRTDGVLTYYYRIDPAVSETVEGFWYVDLEGGEFEEREVTDITLYDTSDTSALVWFTVPKDTGEPIWLPPYFTENLGMRVISYNVPIYWRDTFVGVVGIEIDYTSMAEQVESIRLYNNGYAFLNSAEGELFFHPRYDTATAAAPELPAALQGESTFIRYTFEDVEKQAAWLPLSNGMRLTVTVPVSEAESDWHELVWEIVSVTALVLLALSLFTLYYARRIAMPLEELTWAAEQMDEGNYGFTLKYSGDDEIGRLTSTFKRLAVRIRDSISDLNRRVYMDALTSVKNKGAFTSAIEDLQLQINEPGSRPAFAVGVFDCDELKSVNDRFGHENGDLYLKNACRLICRVFSGSPVFRIGGDVFAVILQNEDYDNLPELVRAFDRALEQNRSAAQNRWEQVHVTMGFAVYDPQIDQNALDTVRRADKAMYLNKRLRKGGADA